MKKLTYIFIIFSVYSQAQITLGKNSPAQTIVSGYTSPGGLSSNPGDLWISQIGGIGNLWGKRNSNWYQFFQTIDTNSILATQYYVNTHGGGGAGIGYASNGLSKDGDSVILGGTLNRPTMIVTGNEPLFFARDGGDPTMGYMALNESYQEIFNTGIITDSGTTSINQQAQKIELYAAAATSGLESYCRVDTDECTLRLNWNGYTYQTGVWDNDGDKHNLDAEISVFSYKGHDVGGLFARPQHLSISVTDTTLDYEDDGIVTYFTPFNFRQDIHGSFSADQSANNFATRLDQDTSFYFGFDSLDAYVRMYYHTDTVSVVSDKVVSFSTPIAIKDGQQGSGKVLTSDADGIANWATLGDGLPTYTDPTTAQVALGSGKPFILSTTIGIVSVLLLAITP